MKNNSQKFKFNNLITKFKLNNNKINNKIIILFKNY